MAREDIKAILEKIRSGEFTPEEERIAKYWLMKLEQQDPTDLTDEELESISNEMWASLETLPDVQPKIKRLWPRIAAAAAILLFVSIGGYFLLHKPKGQATNQTAGRFGNDIAPGHNQATLTLSNGQKIILTKGLNGQLAMQHNTSIKASQDNIVYNAKGEDQISYNTLSTARGEQSPYPLVLADGTKVWLNAESSITFPTAFPGKERIVSVTGEAIFEVAHNAAHPFKINVAGQTVEDIGTEFNINAYADEPTVNVTLSSGKARIIRNGHEAILNPGQAAVTTANTDNIKIKDADLDVAFAWKNGQFLYDNEPLSSVMRQVSRWYDVNVIFDGADPNKLFGGGISRYKNVSQVLRKLELTGGVHFTIEGRRVIARK